MLTNLLALVLLVGLTAASLLVCLAKWGFFEYWQVRRPVLLPKPCQFCAGYWLSVGLLVAVGYFYCRVIQLPMTYLLAALPAGLPAAAVCRAVAGDLG